MNFWIKHAIINLSIQAFKKIWQKTVSVERVFYLIKKLYLYHSLSAFHCTIIVLMNGSKALRCQIFFEYFHFPQTVVTCFPLFHFRLIPESPRWLSLNNSEDKARNQLLKVAKMNKRTLPDDALEKPINLEQRASFRQLFSTWKVAKITLISWNLWYVYGVYILTKRYI